MAYPKPLSEKTLLKQYAQAGINDATKDFLHQFFSACVNVYGGIAIRDMWDVYKNLKEPALMIRKKDLLSFSAIVRREKQPYRVYEIEELYEEEPHSDWDRHVISSDIVLSGQRKFMWFYHLADNVYNHTYYVPEDFLSYASEKRTPEENALFGFLCGLKSTADECVPKYGKNVIPNENKGKRLDEYSFLNSDDRFEVKWLQKRPAMLAEFLEEMSCTEAEKIFRRFKRHENIGLFPMTKLIEFMTDELDETGVQLKEKELQELLRLITESHNNSRLWCIGGWRPVDLAALSMRQGPPAISFGPGMQRAFEEGAIDKTELISKMKEMGFGVIDD